MTANGDWLECCGHRSRVTDSRPVRDSIRRRRVCDGCGRRWTTYETDEDAGRKRRVQIEAALRRFRADMREVW